VTAPLIDTYAKVAFAKLYDLKTPITAADPPNDRVVDLRDGRKVRFRDRLALLCG
jgi:hypothetical protein